MGWIDNPPQLLPTEEIQNCATHPAPLKSRWVAKADLLEKGRLMANQAEEFFAGFLVFLEAA